MKSRRGETAGGDDGREDGGRRRLEEAAGGDGARRRWEETARGDGARRRREETAARVVAAREATVITTEGTRAEAARAWRPRSGVAPAGRTARPLSARAGAWAGVASGEAHRGGAVVPFVLAIAVERAATTAASFREARIGRALPLPGSSSEPPFTDSNGSREDYLQTLCSGRRSLAPPAGACHAHVN